MCCSDVQYADIPDGVSFHGVPRFYRNSLVALRRAVTHLQQSGLPFAIHFGDIVDGFQARHGKVLKAAGVHQALLQAICYTGVMHQSTSGDRKLVPAECSVVRVFPPVPVVKGSSVVSTQAATSRNHAASS